LINMGRLVLLASYPKSGSTWVRAFLASVWNGGTAVDINRLPIPNVSGRLFIDALAGVNSADLADEEVAGLRAQTCDLVTRRGVPERRIFLKIHDALLPAAQQIPAPVNLESAERVLYIVRDPRDVAVSFARHLGLSVDQAICVMEDPRYMLSVYPQRIGTHARQLLSTWSAHVESWVDQAKVPLHVARYEDLLSDPEQHFTRLLEFLGIRFTPQALQGALAATQFAVLRRAEETSGFCEKTPLARRFFNSGVAAGWQRRLTSAQAARIVAGHAGAMRRIGYSC